MKNRLNFISENLPLIPRDIPIEEQIKMAEKKLKFMHENSGVFISTGEYMMTLLSVKNELEEIKKIFKNQSPQIKKSPKDNQRKTETVETSGDNSAPDGITEKSPEDVCECGHHRNSHVDKLRGEYCAVVFVDEDNNITGECSCKKFEPQDVSKGCGEEIDISEETDGEWLEGWKCGDKFSTDFTPYCKKCQKKNEVGK